MSELKDKKRIFIGILIISIMGLIVLPILLVDNINPKLLEKNLELINKECNLVYEDIEGSEEKYKKLLENEKDYFKRGLYSSALVQFYSINGDHENIIKYSKQAQENYLKLKGGEYYVISDKKYIAGVLFRFGNYSECFKIITELLSLLNENKEGLLTKEQVIDTQVLVDSLLLSIYSEFEILDKAKIYYDKLEKIEMTQKLELSKGDKISTSKLIYAEKIKDFKLMKKYAQECYDISLKRDKLNETDVADSVLLSLANANIQLGNFDEAFEQIKKAEKFFSRVNDSYGIINVYSNYAYYYDGVGDVQLANEYYQKAMKLLKELDIYSVLKVTIDEYINFLKSNNIDGNFDSYYKAYYDLSVSLNENEAFNKLVSQILDLNDELNKSTLLLLEEKTRLTEQGILISIGVIIALAVLISRMYSLIKVKNATEKKLEQIANTDYLTGVNTRSYGEKLILEEVKKGNSISMAIIDIDNFKTINDTYGHIFGDTILKEVARKLKENLDENNIVTRFGGEEFTIAFINKNKDEAKEILDSIRVEINKMIFENDVKISFSAGIKEWNDKDINIVVKEADELLYRAKREGKNKVFN